MHKVSSPYKLKVLKTPTTGVETLLLLIWQETEVISTLFYSIGDQNVLLHTLSTSTDEKIL